MGFYHSSFIPREGKKISGWTLLMTNLILEIASAVFDQMGYALIGMVLAFVALLLAAVKLIHMARKERKRADKSLLPLFHPPATYTFATRKRADNSVGTIVEYFGLAGAVWQCVYSTVEYMYTRQKKDNPIKMCLLPFIFLLCVAISKLLVDKSSVEISGWTLLMTNLILEIASAVFDQMGYALIGMVLAFVALLLAAVELIHMARKEITKRAGISLLPRTTCATRKLVGTIVEYFGLAGAVWQCVYSTVEYMYTRQKKDNPIKMCLLPFIFLLCVAISKLLVDKSSVVNSS
ncbi:hypothetical protein NC651_039448 [Populus alba x Populus x berolinensis]|nr:hypothetical protein NC651_039448 [Populus alba x Populus x berolinensis]